MLSLSVTLKLSPLSLPPLARPIISLETQAQALRPTLSQATHLSQLPPKLDPPAIPAADCLSPHCPSLSDRRHPSRLSLLIHSLNSHRSSTHQPSQLLIASDPRRPSRSTSSQLSLSFCSEFFHLGVRCFGLIFLSLCHHAMLWCYFVVKNGVLLLC